MDDIELIELGIAKWDDIKGNFDKADLVLGNGFSINLAPSLHYDSLFQEFLGNCSPQERAIFESFNTTNFEFIMADFIGALKVNRILGLETAQIEAAIVKVREGLIQAIEAKHPRAHNVNWDKLNKLAEDLDGFNDIYTLNYDVLLYHIIMRLRDRHKDDNKVRPYNDFCWSVIDSHYLEFMDYQNYSKYKHIYYLHGALFLFKSGYMEVKLRRGVNTELIDCVENEILNNHLPLFVSEGTPHDKVLAISRSRYLTFASTRLQLAKESIVIYGTSLSDPDKHIREAIIRGTPHLAFSVYIGDRTKEEVAQEIKNMRERLPVKDLVFFDSSTLFAN